MRRMTPRAFFQRDFSSHGTSYLNPGRPSRSFHSNRGMVRPPQTGDSRTGWPGRIVTRSTNFSSQNAHSARGARCGLDDP